MKKLLVYLDGASRGNPGPSGIGIVFRGGKGKVLTQINEYIGEQTNNVSEYMALIRALKETIKYKPKEVTFYLDSQLLVNQVNGLYRTKNKTLLSLLQEVRKLIGDPAKAVGGRFSQVKLQYIPREENKLADKLANQAINLAVL